MKNNCEQRYIGETGRYIKFRIADHRSYITNQVTSRATGAHFNLPGHSLADMKFTILEQVKYNDDTYRKEKETYHINKFNTYYQGINREKWKGEEVVLYSLCAWLFNKPTLFKVLVQSYDKLLSRYQAVPVSKFTMLFVKHP